MPSSVLFHARLKDEKWQALNYIKYCTHVQFKLLQSSDYLMKTKMQEYNTYINVYLGLRNFLYFKGAGIPSDIVTLTSKRDPTHTQPLTILPKIRYPVL